MSEFGSCQKVFIVNKELACEVTINVTPNEPSLILTILTVDPIKQVTVFKENDRLQETSAEFYFLDKNVKLPTNYLMEELNGNGDFYQTEIVAPIKGSNESLLMYIDSFVLENIAWSLGRDGSIYLQDFYGETINFKNGKWESD